MTPVAPERVRTGRGREPLEPLTGRVWHVHPDEEPQRWPWRFEVADALGRVVVCGWAGDEDRARAAVSWWSV